jgi:hypothetical protein
MKKVIGEVCENKGIGRQREEICSCISVALCQGNRPVKAPK